MQMSEVTGRIKIARPTLYNPADYVTINFFGVRGGTGEKRGEYVDYVIFDECEFIEQEFVNQVGFSGSLDRDGLVRLVGTPAAQGNLTHWIDKAKYLEKVREVLRTKQKHKKEIPKEDIVACEEWEYREEDCFTLRVYTDKQLALIKASMSDLAWQQEFLCKDPMISQGFFHRSTMDEIEANGQIHSNI